MKKRNPLRNQEGFTLVEIIAVLIILGILAAVAVPRYIDLEVSSKKRGLEAAVAELNGRESLVWADTKISGSGNATDVMFGVDDEDPFAEGGHLYLGEDYTWDPEPTSASGGTLTFKGQSASVERTKEEPEKPAVWKLTHTP